MARFAFVLALALAAGCGNGSDTTMTGPDMGRGPTDHPKLWQLTLNGGQIQAAPEIYVVVWQGYEAQGQQVADFVDWMVHSDYWTQSLAEYGVGAGKSMGYLVVPSPPPAILKDAQVQALAQGFVSSGMIQANPNTQVHFLIPHETQYPEGGCSVFLGYHDTTNAGGKPLAYSITMQCDPPLAGNIDEITDTLSHEAAEAATDPVPGAGYVGNDPVGQEVSDLCPFSVPIDVPADGTHPARKFWVERLYSSARAAQGNEDPCLPLPSASRPFWGVALDPPTVGGSLLGGVTVNAQLDVFAYGDVGEIKWFAGALDPGVSVTPSSGTAHAGDTIPVTITMDKPAKNAYEIDVEADAAKAGAQIEFGYYLVQ